MFFITYTVSDINWVTCVSCKRSCGGKHKNKSPGVKYNFKLVLLSFPEVQLDII